jgi:bifunctional DNA-binding transcriptional regulator/antitoxin component of YhaV-PrlF toxin-antitoxin module
MFIAWTASFVWFLGWEHMPESARLAIYGVVLVGVESHYSCKGEVESMGELSGVSVDSQGCIVIPPEIQRRLSLLPGMTLVVEEGERGEMCLRVQKELPLVVDKQGVLVVKARVVGDLSAAVDDERGKRLSQIIERVDL